VALDRVGDIEVGFDERFEYFWFRLQRVGWAVMATLVLLGLTGLFGRGPLAKTSAGAEGALLRVDYERFARFRTPTMFVAHVGRAAMESGQVSIWLSSDLLDGMPVERTVPTAVTTAPVSDGVVYTFQVPPEADSATVMFAVQPGKAGRHGGRMALLAGPPPPLDGASGARSAAPPALELRQFIYP
jgi:hypothetical protein